MWMNIASIWSSGMFNSPKQPGLFSFESKNFSDGKRKETRWTIGNSAAVLIWLLLILLAGLPLSKLVNLADIWKLFAR